MKLGNFDLCLPVKDLKLSTHFYITLGFENTRFDSEVGFSTLKYGSLTIALYEKYIEETILNFRGGDVFQIFQFLQSKGLKFESEAIVEPDGSKGAYIRDPDGNLIYFNTAPGEEL